MKRSFFFHLLHIPFGSEIPEKRLNERKCYYRYFSFAPNPILWRKSLPWCMGLFSNRRRSAAYHHSTLQNLMKHLNYTAKSNIFFSSSLHWMVNGIGVLECKRMAVFSFLFRTALYSSACKPIQWDEKEHHLSHQSTQVAYLQYFTSLDLKLRSFY